MKIKLSFLFFIAAFFNTNLLAQEPVDKVDATLDLDGSSFKKEYKVEVKEGTEYLTLRVEGTVSGGQLKVWIENPKGFKCQNITLKANKGGKSKGTMEEVNGPPDPGIWTLCVENKNSNGKVEVFVKTE